MRIRTEYYFSQAVLLLILSTVCDVRLEEIRTGRQEGNGVFYLTTHSTHFILRLYGVGHMVNDHSDSERGNPLPPLGLLFPINSKGFLYASSHRQDSTNHGLCYNSRGALVGTRNSSMGPSHEG